MNIETLRANWASNPKAVVGVYGEKLDECECVYKDADGVPVEEVSLVFIMPDGGARVVAIEDDPGVHDAEEMAEAVWVGYIKEGDIPSW